jgi:diguanylate cyclase (GGDEF)-like protein
MTARLATSVLGNRDTNVVCFHEHHTVRQENARLKQENEALRAQVNQLRNLSHLAFRDDLTGLPNRRYMEKRIREEISRVRRFPQQVFSILLIDINDFKRINDSYGHAKGDATLRWVADFLSTTTRETDVCCRLGGDEFVVIMTNTNSRSAEIAARRITRQLAETDPRTDQLSMHFPVRVSVGISSYGEPGTDVDELIHAADAAMYREKRLSKSHAPVASSKAAA